MAITKPSDIAGNVLDLCPQGNFLTAFGGGAFTSADTSVEATTDGALVQYAPDLSGTGNHASQGTSARRPPIRITPAASSAHLRIQTPVDESAPSATTTQYLAGASFSSLNRRAVSIYVVCDNINTRAYPLRTWFAQGTSYLGAMFGTEADGSSTTRLSFYGGGTGKICTSLSPHCSKEIYHVRSSTTSVLMGMGDDIETLSAFAGDTADTGAFRIGTWNPPAADGGTGSDSNARRAYGGMFRVLVFNSALSDANHALVMEYLRSVHNVPVYDKLVAMVGHSIWCGADTTDNRVFWYQMLRELEKHKACVRLNGQPSRTLSGMLTAATGLTGGNATLAPYVNARAFKKKIAVLAGGTNDFAPIGASTGAQAVTSWQALKAGVEGMGFQTISTTDIDRGAGATWQTHAATFATALREQVPSDRLADLAADIRIGSAGTNANTRFMTAGAIHPNSAGHGIYSEIIGAKLLPLLGSSGSGRVGRSGR